MVKIYEINKFEFDEEKFNESLVLADQDKSTIDFREKVKWAKAIKYVAHAYWAHFDDEEKTFYYFKRIYDQGGYIDDYVYYGLCYFYGYGVERDSQKACDILENACRRLEDNESYHGWAYQMYQMVWYDAHYHEIEKELTQTKEENTLIKDKWSADVKDYNNLLEQYKAKCASYNALTDKYNQLVNEYNTLLQTKRELTDKYNQLVKEYNTLLDNSKQTSQSTNSDLVKVKISYGCVNDLTGWQTNSWQRIEMPRAEYKALLNGSMKAREAYVKNKWLSSWQHAVNVTIALDE